MMQASTSTAVRAIAIGAWLAALTGCATIAQEVAWEKLDVSSPLTAKLPARGSARALPAGAARNPDPTRYAEIGSITVRYGMKRCFPREDCSTKSHTETPTQRLLQEAAAQGGDLVRLGSDNRTGQGQATKAGRCLRTETRQVPTQRCNYEITCSGSFCSSRQTICNTVYVSQTVCAQSETIYGTEHYVESSGTVLREDPELVAQLAFGEEFIGAIKSGRMARVRELVDKGLRPDLPDLRGNYPLLVAAEANQTEAAEFMLAKGADPNNFDGRPLLAAARKGNARVLRAMLDKGGDPNAGISFWSLSKSQAEKRDFPKGQLLAEAAAKGNVEMAQLLLERGANASDPDDKPLAYAVSGRNTELAQLLIKHRADVSAGGVLTAAAEARSLDMVRLLVDAGADVDSNALGKHTALHAAAARGDVEIVRYLIAKRADVDKRGFGQGNTPLMDAVNGGQVDVVRALLEAKADFTTTNLPRGLGLFAGLVGAKGQTALSMARARASVQGKDAKAQQAARQIVDLLVAAGAKE